ncbi:MAG: EAL domain-containing protein [Acidimicrobiales bacterium]
MPTSSLSTIAGRRVRPARATSTYRTSAIILCVGLLGAGFFPFFQGNHRVFVAAVGAIELTAALSARLPLRRPRELMAPGWLLFAAAAAVFGSVAATIDIEQRALGAVVGAVLVGGATARMVRDRLRRLGGEIISEAFLVAASITLAAWGLWVLPQLEQANTVAVCGVTVLGLTGAMLLASVRLRLLDSLVRGPSFLFLTLALVAHAALGPLLIWFGFSSSANAAAYDGWLALVVGTVTAAAAACPAFEPLRNAATSNGTSRIVIRALVPVSATLVGPALFVVGTATKIEVDVTYATITSLVLSVGAAIYMFCLLVRSGTLEHEVYHDELTGLPNRTMFLERLALALEQADRGSWGTAVMFLDVDRFKAVNDSLGHAAGNQVLAAVAKRLLLCSDDDMTVARLAGDEFALLIPRVNGSANARAVAKKLLDKFTEPIAVARRKVYVSPSIGIAHYPADGVDAHGLLERADAAMYRAKERGRNNYQLYTAETRLRALDKLDLESALHRAIVDDQLRLFYQPKVSLRTGLVVGCEALVRWNHPRVGLVTPDQFIPIAEETGMICEIGEWVLIEACTQARRWEEAGTPITVAVNLSARQFQQQAISELVRGVLRFTKCTPELLELELTESLAVGDPDQVQRVLDDFRALGARCSMDDFGMGYSGMGYLDKFRFDVLKIDRTFVRGITSKGSPIVTAVIAMARGLDLEVVAEGVETLPQLAYLHKQGCDLVQGYLTGKAVPAEQFQSIMALDLHALIGSGPVAARIAV